MRGRLIEHWSKHPWNFLAGIDPTDDEWRDRPLIWTTDERDGDEPIKQFPSDMPYLRRYVESLFKDPEPTLVDKSRQMYISSVTMLYLLWMSLFKNGRKSLVSKHKEKLAIALIQDKLRAPYSRLPKWVRIALPLAKMPMKSAVFPGTGSDIMPVTENVAESDAHGFTASVVFIDEAPLQDHFGQIMGAVLPMAAKIIAVGTATAEGEGARVFREYLQKGLKKEIGK